MGRRGRPPKFVLDPNGRPIVGLSYSKSNRCYYATYSNPRVWFARDLAKALFEFGKYENSQRQEEPVVEIPIPDLPQPLKKTGIIEWSDIPNAKKVNFQRKKGKRLSKNSTSPGDFGLRYLRG